MLKDIRPHLRPTLGLAVPVVLSQVGHVLVGFVDSVLVGRLGTVPLAAVSLGLSSVTVIMILGIGLSMGSVPLVAAADGRRDPADLARLLVSSVGLSVLAGLGLVGLGQVVPSLLHYLGQAPAVEALAGPWVRVISWSFLPLMIFQGFREFAEGLGLTRQAMWLSLGGNLVNAALCYALIFGHAGAPALGMVGSAWATLAARWLMAGLMAAYVLLAPKLGEVRAAIRSWWPDAATLRRLFDIGAPIGVQMAFEVGAFAMAAIFIGWLGAVPLAAHQVAINLASMTYMAASGIAAAATIRVGRLAGGGQPAEARLAGFAAYLLGLAFMACMGLLFVLGRHAAPLLYSHDTAVVAQAATLLLIAALFQVSDGLQVVGLGALRGLGDVKVPSVVALLAYWAVALPLSYWLGFGLHYGTPGVWTGLLAGLSIVAVVLLLRFRRETSPGFVLPVPAADVLLPQ